MKFISIAVLFICLAPRVSADSAVRQVKIGFFEGGDYPLHEVLREAFHNELTGLLPENYEAVFIPGGFKSAGWNRQTCRAMAEELVNLKELDMVVAIGPWVVEELLRAGFTRPIIAMYRFDPQAEGLVDSNGVPIAANLTVRIKPGKFENDLAVFTRLRKIDKLGVLFFPSGNEQEKVMAHFNRLGEKLGFETVTAEGFNNVGTYAFFKAYGKLKEQGVRAIYISPLWGFDLAKINWFLKEAARDHIMIFTSEGSALVQRGALASNAQNTIAATARYHAYKASRIIMGVLPADLPVVFPEATGLTLNEEMAQKFKIIIPDETIAGIEVIPALPAEDISKITLSQAIETAFQSNPGYLAGYDAVEVAAGEAGRAYAEYLPHLNLTGSARHVDENTVNNYRGEVKDNQYSLSLNFEQQIFSLGAIRAIQLAARQKGKYAISLKEASLDLEMAVTIAYLNYLKAREILAVYLEKKQYIGYNFELSQADRYLTESEGIDVYRWHEEYLKVSREIGECKKNIKIARVLFNLLLSQSGNTTFMLDTALFSGEQWNKEMSLMQVFTFERQKARKTEDYLVTQALAGNPSLESCATDIDLQKLRLAGNTARFFPTVGFRASFNIQDSLIDFSPGFTEKNKTWSIGATLSLPLFQGTARFKERQVLKARLSELEYRKDKVRLEIMAEVHSLVLETINCLNRVSDDLEAEKQARVYADLMMRRYSAGKAALHEVIEAIDNAAQARYRSIADRYGYFENATRLINKVGWSVRDSNRTPGMELIFKIHQYFQASDGDSN